MNPRIIPVLDLKDGQVVHAVAGARSKYRPLRSVLAADSRPATLVAALQAGGAREVYIADLDAIESRPPNWNDVRAVVRSGLQVYLDAGVGRGDLAQRLHREVRTRAAAARVRFVLGLESIQDPAELPAILAELGRENCVFSLDLFAGQPITMLSCWQELAPLQLAQRLLTDLQVPGLIVLDLSQVGTAAGVPDKLPCLLQQLRAQFPKLEILSGGGVRNLRDVQRFLSAGCSGVLVSTAIHRGGIPVMSAQQPPN